MFKNVVGKNVNIFAVHVCGTGFSVEQLTRNSRIEMVYGIYRMKSQKREQLSVSCVLMKSLSSVSTIEFGRFSWLVVQQLLQRWVTFILKFYRLHCIRNWTVVSVTVHCLRCPFFLGWNRKEKSAVW